MFREISWLRLRRPSPRTCPKVTTHTVENTPPTHYQRGAVRTCIDKSSSAGTAKMMQFVVKGACDNVMLPTACCINTRRETAFSLILLVRSETQDNTAVAHGLRSTHSLVLRQLVLLITPARSPLPSISAPLLESHHVQLTDPSPTRPLVHMDAAVAPAGIIVAHYFYYRRCIGCCGTLPSLAQGDHRDVNRPHEY